MFTVDASVWVNAESPTEPGYRDSRGLLDVLFAAGTIVVLPTLLLAELAGVISRTRGDSILARRMVAAVATLPQITWVDLDGIGAADAAELAAAHRLRGADAVYAAVARTHGCTLVSLDREHLTRLGPAVRTITPADALAILGHPRPQP